LSLFDELISALDDLLHRLALAFEHGVGDAARVQANRAARIIVAGNDVGDAVGTVIGIDDGDDGNAKLLRLGDGDLVISDVDYEYRIRQRTHVFDAAQTLVQLVELAR